MKKTAIVVLGAPNDAEGNLSSLAIERCQQALAEFARNPDAYFLPTGGWGEHFNTTDQPHGHYLRDYLMKHGVPGDRILECAESRNTIQDAVLCKPIVARHGLTALIVVTSDFHLPRAEYLFRREFHTVGLSFSAATTHMPEGDLVKRKQHEERALTRLIQEDSQVTTE